jgi:hypothetical protein
MSETFVPARALDPTNTPYQNLIANGGFDNWSRGLTFTNPVPSTRIADAWTYVKSAAGTQPTADVSAETTLIDSGVYAVKINCTNAGSGINDGVYIEQVPSVLFAQSVRGQTLTLSARIKTSTANKWRINIGDSLGATFSSYHSGSGNYETLTVTRAISATVTVIYFSIGMIQAANVAISTGYIDSVMLVIGSAAMNYVAGHTEIEKVKIGAVSDLQDNVPNILANGSFDIWQRGTSFSSPATSTYSADRWKMGKDGTPTFTISKETSIVDGAGASWKLDVTVVGGATGIYFSQAIENYLNYSGLNVSLSVRVKCSVANIFTVQIYDGTNVKKSQPHSGSGNWETLTATMIMPSIPTAMNFYFGLINDGVSVGTFYVDNAMAIVGTTPITFVPADPQIDMARCQRYYETNPSFIASFTVTTATDWRLPINFAVEKFAIPTMTVTAGSTSGPYSSITGNGLSKRGFSINVVSNGTAGAIMIGTANNATWQAEVA